MIPIHKHLKKEFYKEAVHSKISNHHPVIMIADSPHSFLNLTLHYVLKSRKVPHLTNNVSHDK